MENLILIRADDIVTRINMNSSISIGKFSTEKDVIYHLVEAEAATLFSLINGERNVKRIMSDMKEIYSHLSFIDLSYIIKNFISNGIVKIK